MVNFVQIFVFLLILVIKYLVCKLKNLTLQPEEYKK